MTGSDLQHWTITNLQQAIKGFKQQQIQKKSMVQSKKSISANNNDQPLTYNPKKQMYYKQLTCGKIIPSTLFSKKCQIRINRWQKIEGNLFTKKLYVYQIQVKGLSDWNVSLTKRRFSDFEWLRNSLINIYTYLPIPPLPNKGKIKRDYEKHITKRMLLLQRFLQKIYRNPQISANPIFENFLTLQSEQFENYKNQYNTPKNTSVSSPSISSLSDIKNISGEITLFLNEDSQKLIDETKKYINQAQPQIKQIYKKVKAIGAHLQVVGDLFKQISMRANTVSEKYRQLTGYMFEKTPPQNIYTFLRSNSAQYGQIFKEQASIFCKKIHPILKYENNYMAELIANIQKLKSTQKTYFENKLALFQRKQKLYLENNPKRWELEEQIYIQPQNKQQVFDLMLYKDTKILKKSREQYAYQNYQVYREVMRLFNENQECLQNQMGKFAEKQMEFAVTKYKIWESYKQKCKKN